MQYSFTQFGKEMNLPPFRAHESDAGFDLHAAAYEVVNTSARFDVTTYAIDGALDTPDQRRPLVRSVWALEQGSEAPRLVTAYPL